MIKRFEGWELRESAAIVSVSVRLCLCLCLCVGVRLSGSLCLCVSLCVWVYARVCAQACKYRTKTQNDKEHVTQRANLCNPLKAYLPPNNKKDCSRLTEALSL